jgi:hypothetical protein
LSIPSPWTNHDAVEQIAKHAQIPVESSCSDLDHPIYTRGLPIFGFAGDEFDEITRNYDNMQWWVSEIGLNMAIVSRPRRPTFDELWLEGKTEKSKTKKRRRRNKRYEAIDAALKQIAESRPRTQKEVFQSLEQRRVPFPPAHPFFSAGGWIEGFKRDPEAARAWLSKWWSELDLQPLPRGPKGGRK